MNESPVGKWAISSDGENYVLEPFETKEDAIAEGLASYSSGFYVGRIVAPPPPEDLFRAEDWLDHVSVQEEYSGDYAEDWDMSTKEQREELEAEVRKIMAAWLDRNNLRPTFFNVVEEDRIDVLSSDE